VRGLRVLRACDAVVHDRLVSPTLLEYAEFATLYYVGKRDGDRESATQESINALLIQLARQGKQVVRLKGGDPCVFGRGGEEAIALTQANIPFEIVPGVTAGTAVPAAAGIPVTHRGLSSAVTFVTANADPARINAPVDWVALGAVPGTLVIFMGARTFEGVAPLLIRGGLSPETPAAAVERGTYPSQRVLSATLGTLADHVTLAGFTAPVTFIIGDVVRVRDQIDFLEPRREELSVA
jgi:uroporphyrin-III C-methyltransferase